MKHTEMRRQAQIAFLKSNQNIVIGTLNNFPLTLDQLKQIDNDNTKIIDKIESGLTSIIYNFEVNNHKYNLKIKRNKILVDNPDGQTSFLNEVQRRLEFEELRKHNRIIDEGVVKTIYANLNQGMILSEYIDGYHLSNYTEEDLSRLFELLFELDIHGFFEWDLCRGNIMKENNRIVLFDFGYMYKFDPLHEFNSEGIDEPAFYPIERFETRQYLHIIRDLDEKTSLTRYRVLKILTKNYLNKKIRWLADNKADNNIIETFQERVVYIDKVLQSEILLKENYISDMYRATALDIMDDISGKTCTVHTIKKITYMKTIIDSNYETLKRIKAFLIEDDMSKSDLLKKYNQLSKLVYKYQIDSSKHNE